MHDLISRQAAIDELDKGAWGAEWDKTLAKTMIESLPSAQPEPIKINIEDFNKEDWERLKKEWGNTPITVLPSAQPERKNAWISVHDAMPEEKQSIFAKYKGTAKWQKSFWEKQSDIVLVAIACKDGYKFVTTARTVDAVWNCDHLAIRGSEAIAWQPFPEPPEE